jgi:hypothetical protein
MHPKGIVALRGVQVEIRTAAGVFLGKSAWNVETRPSCIDGVETTECSDVKAVLTFPLDKCSSAVDR